MPRRADETQGRFDLSIPDAPDRPAPDETEDGGHGRHSAAKHNEAEGQGRTTPRRRRHQVSRPVRGEPDVALPAYRSDWRIDGKTRRVGMSGVARARAALAAVGHHGELGDRKVDAA